MWRGPRNVCFMTVDKWSDLFLLLLLLLIPEPLPLPPTIAPPHHEFSCCRVSLSFDFHSSTKFSRCAFTNWVNCCTLVLNVQKRLCRVRFGISWPIFNFLVFLVWQTLTWSVGSLNLRWNSDNWTEAKRFLTLWWCLIPKGRISGWCTLTRLPKLMP